MDFASPLVSVIIPCYNHGHYLAAAIESVLAQSHQSHEIIVIDDGSWDDTATVAAEYPQAKYFYQANSGLPASRNLGVKNSTGNFLVFLDADDWLHPKALQLNLDYLNQNPEAAFVAGAHQMVQQDLNQENFVPNQPRAEPYCLLLEKNYIAMHAAVMFNRWVFDRFQYDVALKSCEDYDLYFKIVRNFKIINHNQLIAYYRKHSSNMSGNEVFMLKNALEVLNRQQPLLKSKEEKQWFKAGQHFWPYYYASMLQTRLCNKLYTNHHITLKEWYNLFLMNKKWFVIMVKTMAEYQYKTHFLSR